jgi:hypothetical protein
VPYEWSPADCGADGVCNPVIVPWSHNTFIVRPNVSSAPELMLFHIGDGVAPRECQQCLLAPPLLRFM